jgi:hypothetical protein
MYDCDAQLLLSQMMLLWFCAFFLIRKTLKICFLRSIYYCAYHVSSSRWLIEREIHSIKLLCQPIMRVCMCMRACELQVPVPVLFTCQQLTYTLMLFTVSQPTFPLRLTLIVHARIVIKFQNIKTSIGNLQLCNYVIYFSGFYSQQSLGHTSQK